MGKKGGWVKERERGGGVVETDRQTDRQTDKQTDTEEQRKRTKKRKM